MNFQSYQTDENTSYQSYRFPTCNLVNPITHFGDAVQELNYRFDLMTKEAMPDYQQLKSSTKLEWAIRSKAMAKQRWKQEYLKIEQAALPTDLLQLLQERKKKAQKKIVARLIFDTDLLICTPIHAWLKFRMPYSRLISEYHAKEFAGKVYPAMMHLKDDGEFEFFGVTDMSPAEIKVAIAKKHKVIGDFIGDENYWHCFFRTESGIRGKEAPHLGQPHIHYISSAWGISRNDIIKNLSSYRYSLKAETIPFTPRT
ncbi:hypothetical protein [Mucilaginibacter paludis]|uniref:Uncharacterized protein n=1 Tax=Mucilaginibacter paludis DSM 18603 TaxID=714943 RepID=H1YEE2_9SPHI|nr:hypothetical protein [Mucilaginibacter paludis]EHQ27176.1 hypothetical protein Mucpa_3072 [Mucilaginibacter paludis DSM 18603]